MSQLLIVIHLIISMVLPNLFSMKCCIGAVYDMVPTMTPIRVIRFLLVAFSLLLVRTRVKRSVNNDQISICT